MSILIYFATIFWSLFPNLIHVFQGGDNYVVKVNETNLVVNADLTIPSANPNIPQGFINAFTTSYSLINGIYTYTSNAQYGLIRQQIVSLSLSDTYYCYARYKADSPIVRLEVFGGTFVNHSGSGNFELVSKLAIPNQTTAYLLVGDHRTSSWTQVSVDYMGAYNVSTMKNNGVKNDAGILFSDLSNEEIRLQLDQWINKNGQLTFKIDNTYDKWFNTGFVDKTAERDFIDYLGYFFWLSTPPIILFITLDLLRRII